MYPKRKSVGMGRTRQKVPGPQAPRGLWSQEWPTCAVCSVLQNTAEPNQTEWTPEKKTKVQETKHGADCNAHYSNQVMRKPGKGNAVRECLDHPLSSPCSKLRQRRVLLPKKGGDRSDPHESSLRRALTGAGSPIVVGCVSTSGSVQSLRPFWQCHFPTPTGRSGLLPHDWERERGRERFMWV